MRKCRQAYRKRLSRRGGDKFLVKNPCDKGMYQKEKLLAVHEHNEYI